MSRYRVHSGIERSLTQKYAGAAEPPRGAVTAVPPELNVRVRGFFVISCASVGLSHGLRSEASKHCCVESGRYFFADEILDR